MPENTIDRLQIEVGASSEKAAKNIRALASSLRILKKAVAENDKLSDLSQRMKTLSDSLDGLRDAQGVVGLSQALRTIGNQEEKIGAVADYLRGISHLDFSNLVSASDVIANIAKISSSVKSAISDSPNSFRKKIWPDNPLIFGEETSESKTGTGVIGDATFLKGFLRILSDAKTGVDLFGSGLKKVAGIGGGLFARAFLAATRYTIRFYRAIVNIPFRGIARNIIGASNAIKQFFASVGRILMYRAIRTVIKDITQGIKEGVENLSAYSRLIGTEFHKTLDSLATDALYVKNSFATVVAPIINLVRPAFDALADSIANAMNLLARFVAMMTGAESYSKAVRHATEYGDAIQKAGAKAKEARKHLLGIDELNIFDDTKSASGGGFNADDYKSMFEEVAIEPLDFSSWGEAFSYAVDHIRESIPKLESVFSDFASRVNTQTMKITEMFTFPGVIEKVRLLGEELSGAFNALTAQINWYTIGTALGSGWNTAIQFLVGFIYGYNWKTLGTSIASMINGVVGSINWKDYGKLLAAKFTIAIDFFAGVITGLNMPRLAAALSDIAIGMFDTITDALDKINWAQIGEQISAFLTGIDWKGVGRAVANSFNAVVKALYDAVTNIDWKTFAMNLFHGLNVFIKEVDWGKVGETFSAALHGALEFMKQGISSFDWAALGNAIREFIKGIDWWQLYADFLTIGAYVIKGLLEGIGTLVVGLPGAIKSMVIDPLINTFKNLLGINSPSKVFAEIGGFVAEGFLQGMKDAWSGVTSWLTTALSNLKQTASNTISNIKTTASNAWNNVKSGGSTKTSVRAYATGGFPEDGFFYANHNELVGQFSNGRTAVANNDQITTGIYQAARDANAEVVSALVQIGNNLVQAINNKDTSVQLDGMSFARGMRRFNQLVDNQYGKSLVSGGASI